MIKQKYETLILAHPQITADELSAIENFFVTVSTDAKGDLLNFDKWGKYRLSYAIKKNDYGIYILARYELPTDNRSSIFKDIETFFKIKCNETVMRYVTKKLSASAPKAYRFPDPIDAGKTTNLDSFIKENKMETFLGNDKESKEAVASDSTEKVVSEEATDTNEQKEG